MSTDILQKHFKESANNNFSSKPLPDVVQSICDSYSLDSQDMKKIYYLLEEVIVYSDNWIEHWSSTQKIQKLVEELKPRFQFSEYAKKFHEKISSLAKDGALGSEKYIKSTRDLQTYRNHKAAYFTQATVEYLKDQGLKVKTSIELIVSMVNDFAPDLLYGDRDNQAEFVKKSWWLKKK